MAFTSKKQRIACERNSLKWQLLGLTKNLSSMCDRSKHMTDGEQEKLIRSIEVLNDILHWWNHSNTEFGLNNPDTKKGK